MHSPSVRHAESLSPSCTLPRSVMQSPSTQSPSCTVRRSVMQSPSYSPSCTVRRSVMQSPSCTVRRSVMQSPSCRVPHPESLMLLLSLAVFSAAPHAPLGSLHSLALLSNDVGRPPRQSPSCGTSGAPRTKTGGPPAPRTGGGTKTGGPPAPRTGGGSGGRRTSGPHAASAGNAATPAPPGGAGGPRIKGGLAAPAPRHRLCPSAARRVLHGAADSLVDAAPLSQAGRSACAASP